MDHRATKHVIDLSIRGLPAYDRNGNATGIFKPDLDAAISGLKLAAKIAGLVASQLCHAKNAAADTWAPKIGR